MSNQLVKKNPAEGYQNVFPKTWIDAIKDKESGVSLQEILQGFNMYFLSYNGSRALTRCKVPYVLRKEGLWITYVLYDHTVVTEWYNSDQIDDSSWSMDSNWRVASNSLVGDVSISSDGYWVVNGEKTEAKAQGEQGVTPLLRIGANNKLQVSYNLGKFWRDISDYIVPRFRYTRGTTNNTAGIIQISMDLGKTWTNLSNEITNNLRISRYIGINESLPISGIAEGTVYMKGPYYDEADTLNENPIYRMWIYAWNGTTLAWQDNGEFTSISAGVVQERGNSTTEVMSQAAVTRELTELESEVILSAEFDFSDGISEKPFLFRKGHTYKVTNKGNVICAVATRLTQTSENLDEVQSIYANSSKTFIATADANYIRCAYSTQIEVSDLSNVVNGLKSGITQNQSDVQDLSNVINTFEGRVAELEANDVLQDEKLVELESEVLLTATFDFTDGGASARPFYFKKGQTYKVTNKGSVTCVVSTKLTPTSENIDVVQSLYSNYTKEFVASSDAYYINCAYSVIIELSDLPNGINEVSKSLDEYKQQSSTNFTLVEGKISHNESKKIYTFPNNDSILVHFEFRKGEKYRLLNIGDVTSVVTTRGEDSSTKVDTINSLYPYVPKEFVASGDAIYMACAQETTIVIEPLDNDINRIYDTISTVRNYSQFVTQGTIPYADVIDVNTISSSANFGHLVLKVSAGDIVKVKGYGGSAARLLTMTDDNYNSLYVSVGDYNGEELFEVVVDGYAIINVQTFYDYSIEVISHTNNIGSHLDSKLDKADYANELSTEFTESGGKTISFKIVKGLTYRITNVRSNGALIFRTREMHTSAYIDSTASNLYEGQSYTFIASASTDLVYVYMNNAGVAKIEQLDTISKDIESLKSAALNPLVSFDSAEDLIDVADIFGEFDFSNGMYQSDTMEQIIAKFDALKEQHSDYISKHDSLTFASEIYSDIEYPWYTRGINAEEVRTIDYGNGRTKNITFKVTPLYNIPVYKLSSNDNIGKSYYADSAEYPKKKVFLYAGGHGNENFAPYNLYQFAYNLCNATTGNYAKLRATCEFYILPYLNGYGCYHTMRCNANRVDIERAFPTSRFTPSDYDTIDSNTACTYTGEVGGKEFETRLIMGCIQAINPSLTFSCHNYGKESSSQFYANTSYEDMFKGFTKALLNVIHPICKKFEEYYGWYSTFNQNLSVRYDGIGYPYIWMRENGYFGGLVEVGNSINFLGGVANTNADSKPSFNVDVASIAEVELRHILCAILSQIVA